MQQEERVLANVFCCAAFSIIRPVPGVWGTVVPLWQLSVCDQTLPEAFIVVRRVCLAPDMRGL